MDSNLLVQTLNNSPSVKLLKMRNAEFFLAFVTSVFDEQMAIREEKLHMLLENRLDNQRDSITVDDIGIDTLGESNEAKAKRLIKEWTDKGFFANYQNEEGEIIYELSSHTSKVIDWVSSLKKEEYIGTESKFKTCFHSLRNWWNTRMKTEKSAWKYLSKRRKTSNVRLNEWRWAKRLKCMKTIRLNQDIIT